MKKISIFGSLAALADEGEPVDFVCAGNGDDPKVLYDIYSTSNHDALMSGYTGGAVMNGYLVDDHQTQKRFPVFFENYDEMIEALKKYRELESVKDLCDEKYHVNAKPYKNLRTAIKDLRKFCSSDRVCQNHFVCRFPAQSQGKPPSKTENDV